MNTEKWNGQYKNKLIAIIFALGISFSSVVSAAEDAKPDLIDFDLHGMLQVWVESIDYEAPLLANERAVVKSKFNILALAASVIF